MSHLRLTPILFNQYPIANWFVFIKLDDSPSLDDTAPPVHICCIFYQMFLSPLTFANKPKVNR